MVMGELILDTDLVVLGGGPGGYTAALRVAALHVVGVLLGELGFALLVRESRERAGDPMVKFVIRSLLSGAFARIKDRLASFAGRQRITTHQVERGISNRTKYIELKISRFLIRSEQPTERFMDRILGSVRTPRDC